jgi:antitoxin ParD1/3/4
MSIKIDDRMEEFIDQQVGQGKYDSLDDIVDAGLRLLQHQAEIEAIRVAIAEGEGSGEIETFDGEEFLKEMHRKYAQ